MWHFSVPFFCTSAHHFSSIKKTFHLTKEKPFNLHSYPSIEHPTLSHSLDHKSSWQQHWSWTLTEVLQIWTHRKSKTRTQEKKRGKSQLGQKFLAHFSYTFISYFMTYVIRGYWFIECLFTDKKGISDKVVRKGRMKNVDKRNRMILSFFSVEVKNDVRVDERWKGYIMEKVVGDEMI